MLKRIGTGKDDDGAPPRPKKPEEWMAPVVPNQLELDVCIVCGVVKVEIL